MSMSVQPVYEPEFHTTITTQNAIPFLKTAIFVDFDNIYHALKDIVPAAAESFATTPGRWIDWIARGMPDREDRNVTGRQQCHILVRRCYLNPTIAAYSRAHFIRAAFSVVDCPSLTSNGKNSADIHMVMDILDALEHRTHFDEFIILSGDSDFTPVLLRLRTHARQTAILTIRHASGAYIAAADYVISGDHFIEAGLGHVSRRSELRIVEGEASQRARRGSSQLSQRNAPDAQITDISAARHPTSTPDTAPFLPSMPAPKPPLEELKAQAIAFVRQIVSNAPEPVRMAQVASAVINQFGEQVKTTQWFAAGSFKNFVKKSVAGISVVTGANMPDYLYDPTRHTLPSAPVGVGPTQETEIDC